MIETLLLPKLGEGIESGTVVAVSVVMGEAVVAGQTLFEVETDKVSVEVPSTVDGSVTDLFVAPGDEVPVGGRLAAIERSAGSGAPLATVDQTYAEGRSAPESTVVAGLPVGNVGGTTSGEGREPDQRASVYGSLPDHPAPAGPAARRMARELGIDIRSVPGSGQRGRIAKQDVVVYARQLLKGERRADDQSAATALPDLTRFGPVETAPLANIQRAMARNMTRAWREIPHAWIQDRIDITELERVRSRLKAEAADQGLPLSITPFVVKAMALTLEAFPLFNASIDMIRDEVVYRRSIDIGVAVDTPRGLVVPVIRDVEDKGLNVIAKELAGLAERARSNTLQVDELQGAGMTLSNLGSMGVGNIFPIINWPQSSIIGVASAYWSQERDSSGEWIERLIMPVTMAIDHRLINGADGARFLARMRGLLEDPDRLLLLGSFN